MFVGHYAVGLVAKKVEPKLNLGWVFLAVMLPDALLGLFVLLGIEKVTIPVNYQDLRYLTFEFPFSHGLVAALLWSGLTFVFFNWLWRRNARATKMAALMAAAVFSHFLLDVIVHIPEIPLLAQDSLKIGLGLWHHLGVALGFETFITFMGLVIYLKANPNIRLRAKIGLPILIGFLILFTVGGQLFSPAPPNAASLAASWIVMTIIIALIGYWLEKGIAPSPFFSRLQNAITLSPKRNQL